MQIKIDFERGVGRGAQKIYSPEPMSQLCGECAKGKLCVTSSGKVYPCVFSRFAELGDVREGFRQIIDGNSLVAFRTNLNYYHQKQRLREDNDPGRPIGRPNNPASQLTDDRHEVACAPTCSPCQPEAFTRKCAPHAAECMPAPCSPACAPSCSPSSPCAPDTQCGPDNK